MTEPVSQLSTLTIGKVLDELRAEFPDITVTKIRYLEDEGLIKPSRTAAGYRKFSYADVERLRYILAGQRDNFWPLKYIRQLLDDLDNGVAPDVSTPTVKVPGLDTDADGFPTPEAFAPRTSTVRLSRDELCESAGITPDLLVEIETYGLIDQRPSQTYYDASALAIASLVGEFALLGIEPRHLRAFRTSADREIGLFQQALSPGRKPHDSQARQEALKAAQRLAALSVRLHAMLVKNGLAGFV